VELLKDAPFLAGRHLTRIEKLVNDKQSSLFGTFVRYIFVFKFQCYKTFLLTVYNVQGEEEADAKWMRFKPTFFNTPNKIWC